MDLHQDPRPCQGRNGNRIEQVGFRPFGIADDQRPVRLAHGARQMPAVGRELIFMPESGPFVRFEADEEGKVQLPGPEESGTLRIDAGVIQVLRIRRKK